MTGGRVGRYGERQDRSIRQHEANSFSSITLTDIPIGITSSFRHPACRSCSHTTPRHSWRLDPHPLCHHDSYHFCHLDRRDLNQVRSEIDIPHHSGLPGNTHKARSSPPSSGIRSIKDPNFRRPDFVCKNDRIRRRCTPCRIPSRFSTGLILLPFFNVNCKGSSGFSVKKDAIYACFLPHKNPFHLRYIEAGKNTCSIKKILYNYFSIMY
jgi:hypothetical protein